MIKIIIVDDHALFREGIKVLIDTENIGEVIGEAENGKVFLDLLKEQKPDLVMMDIEMPVMGGFEAIQKAMLIQPDIKVLVLTMLSDRNNYHNMINAGAMGYMLKSSDKAEFAKAVKAVMDGELYFSNELIRMIIMDMDFPVSNHNHEKHTENDSELTVREREVLSLFCQGLTVSEIAGTLFLSPKTVEAHRSALIKKTNTKNTINLILHAIKNKMVKI
ncbi:MAG: response regulator transcription factor [Paludibacter sp.]